MLAPARFCLTLFLTLTLPALAGCGDSVSKPPPDDTSCTVGPIDAGTGLEMPPPTGKHAAIGTHTRMLVDESRDEEVTPEPDKRAFVVQLWYPADPCAEGTATPYYLPAEIADHEQDGFPQDIPEKTFLHAKTGVALAPGGDKYPVLLFSHGFGMLRGEYASLFEDLASHGFVVATLSHTYDTTITVFPDGRVVPFGPSFGPPMSPEPTPEEVAAFEAELDAHIQVWVDDARFALDEITRWNKSDPEGLFTGRLDLERVGMFGHSYGGAAAAEVGVADDRVLAGLNMDGTFYGPARTTGGRALEEPFLMLNAEGHAAEDPTPAATFDKAQAEVYLVEVGGATHMGFSDLELLGKHFMIPGYEQSSGSIDAARLIAISRAYVLAFFGKHLRGDAAPLLDVPSGSAPKDFPEITTFMRRP